MFLYFTSYAPSPPHYRFLPSRFLPQLSSIVIPLRLLLSLSWHLGPGALSVFLHTSLSFFFFSFLYPAPSLRSRSFWSFSFSLSLPLSPFTLCLPTLPPFLPVPFSLPLAVSVLASLHCFSCLYMSLSLSRCLPFSLSPFLSLAILSIARCPSLARARALSFPMPRSRALSFSLSPCPFYIFRLSILFGASFFSPSDSFSLPVCSPRWQPRPQKTH